MQIVFQAYFCVLGIYQSFKFLCVLFEIRLINTCVTFFSFIIMRTYFFYADDVRTVQIRTFSLFLARLFLWFHGVRSPQYIGSWRS